MNTKPSRHEAGGFSSNLSTHLSLREKLTEMCRPHVSDKSSYAIVDFPNYPNVGDSAIWLGQLAVLRSLTRRAPSYVASHANFDADELKEFCPVGPVFISGGGNLGDTWQSHSQLREKLLTLLPERRIIQLPQSIRFSEERNAEHFGSLARQHADFHLYVRDQPSLEFADKKLGLLAHLTPDSAFGLPIINRGLPKRNVVLLLRDDIERRYYDRQLLNAIPAAKQVDWARDPIRVKISDILSKLYIKTVFRGDMAARVRNYQTIASLRMYNGLELLSNGRSVITDRLHGHILALLLDIPHVVLDNNSGKVFDFYNQWTSGCARAKTAVDAPGAIQALADVSV